MRRLARHLFALCSVVSMALCVAALGIWPASYWKSGAVAHRGQSGTLAVQWLRGRVDVGGDNVTRAAHALDFDSWDVTPDMVWSDSGAGQWWNRLGFAHDIAVNPAPVAATGGTAGPGGGASVVSWQASAPLWAAVLVLIPLPLTWLNQWSTRRHRARSGLCPTCGYDLRASPERCPECGTPTKARTA
jgi:hypothetical protein